MSKSEKAVQHILTRIQKDPRLAYYMGPGTESLDLLIDAQSEITGESVDSIRSNVFSSLLTEEPSCGYMKCKKDNCDEN